MLSDLTSSEQFIDEAVNSEEEEGFGADFVVGRPSEASQGGEIELNNNQPDTPYDDAEPIPPEEQDTEELAALDTAFHGVAQTFSDSESECSELEFESSTAPKRKPSLWDRCLLSACGGCMSRKASQFTKVDESQMV